jgi:hypothetical protein
VFVACCILHSMLVDHDGIDNWDHRMRRCRFKRDEDTVDFTAVQLSCHRMTDDSLYNREDKNAPGPNHTNKNEDYYANDDTDHARPTVFEI